MNWEAIGAVGEIVGAAAVVVTLIYLAGQVRHATKATQAAGVQAASALDQEFLLALGQNPEATRIWTTYMWGDLDTLSEAERMQGFFLFGSTLRRLENVHNQYQLGTISGDAWRSRQGMYAGIARSKAFAAHLKGPAKSWMAGDFVEFMNQLAAEDLESDA